jgi:hypothetical protein
VSLSGSPAINGMIIRVSTNSTLSCMVYLDVEPSQPLTQSYWNGWANAVRNYRYLDANGVSQQPFLPGGYINPKNDSYCATLCANANTTGIWTQQFCCCGPGGGQTNCPTCTFPGPSWTCVAAVPPQQPNPLCPPCVNCPPTDCSCGGPGWPHPRLWQFALNGGCGSLGWDFDQSTASWDECVNMIAFFWPGSPCRTCQ